MSTAEAAYTELREMADSASEEAKQKEKDKAKKFRDINVVVGDPSVKQIVLPEGMSPAEAIKWIRRHEEQQELEVAINVEIDAYPMDGAIALARVFKRIFGWTDLIPTPTFFGPKPPAMIEIWISPTQTAQVHWGRMTIPGVEGFIETSYSQEGRKCIFRIAGVVKRKHEKLVKGIAEAVREEVKTNSIYKGQALIVNFRDEDGNPKEFSPADCPQFMPVDDIDQRELIFPKITMDLLQDTLFNVIEKLDLCRKMQTPAKRGIMLEGPYGVGKTQAARLTAKKCVENDWTYIYVKDVQDLDAALELAKQYQPAVVFGEDVDRFIGQERTRDVDKYLNILDGVDTKTHEIIVVLTTNDVAAITDAMKRPGRIDTIIPVRAPDANAAARLVTLYGRGMVSATIAQLEEALMPIVELKSNAAMFREVVERAKLSAMGKLAKDADVDSIDITAENIRIAAIGMKEHLGYLRGVQVETATAMQQLGAAMGRQIGQAMAQTKSSDLLPVAEAAKPGLKEIAG